MKTSALLPLLLLASCAATPASRATDDAVGNEALRIADSHALAFKAPARSTPSTQMVDGALLGNGDLGVAIAGNPEALRFHIGKNDLWSIPAKTVRTLGRIELLTPALAGAPYQAACDMRRARWTGAFAKDGSALRVRAFVDAHAGRLVVELENAGKEPLATGFRLIQGERTPVEGTAFLRQPDGDKQGVRQAAVAARAVGQPGLSFTLAPGAKTCFVAAILSDLDAKDPLKEAQAQVAALTPENIAAAAKAHEAWWDAYWRKSFVEIPDKVIEKHWYAAQYILGSCCRPGKVAPGLWGNWITVDNPRWSGDYTLNYNFQAPFYSVFSSNHPELARPFFAAMNQSIPGGKRFAEDRGWKGIHLPTAIGPWGISVSKNGASLGQRSNAVYSALIYGWHWRATRDKAWLEKDGYAYMREVAAFWTDYLKLENGPDGKPRYVIPHDAIHEASGGAGYDGLSSDFNPIFSLGAVRALYRDMLDMSEALGVDADLRPKWKDILEKISAFPTQEKGGKTVFRYTEQGTAWWGDNTLGIQHIYPAGAIGLGSDPKLLEISKNMIDAMGRWNDDNGAASWYSACARIGYDPAKTLAGMRRMYDRHVMQNGLLYFGGGGIENVSPAAAVNEMLMQSHEGVLRLFPAWPKDQDARFGSLRADGAFLVSAQLKGGEVRGVEITSEKGMPLAVQNPWPGQKVRVIRSGALKQLELVEGERFTLKTSPGEVLTLAPGTAGHQTR